MNLEFLPQALRLFFYWPVPWGDVILAVRAQAKTLVAFLTEWMFAGQTIAQTGVSHSIEANWRVDTTVPLAMITQPISRGERGAGNDNAHPK